MDFAIRVVRMFTKLPKTTKAQVLWAKDEGFLKKAGIDADITLINNGAAIASAVAAGAVDIGQANLVSLATAHERGLPFVLIGLSSVWFLRRLGRREAVIIVSRASAPLQARTALLSTRGSRGRGPGVGGLSGQKAVSSLHKLVASLRHASTRARIFPWRGGPLRERT